jgi:hypothetical protein
MNSSAAAQQPSSFKTSSSRARSHFFPPFSFLAPRGSHCPRHGPGPGGRLVRHRIGRARRRSARSGSSRPNSATGRFPSTPVPTAPSPWRSGRVGTCGSWPVWRPRPGRRRRPGMRSSRSPAGGHRKLRDRGAPVHAERGWSVSVRVQVPRGTDLTLSTTNGSIKVEGVSGPSPAAPPTGPSLPRSFGGPANLRTTNGSIQAHFDGPLPPEGEVRLRTTNGGVDLTLPRDVSARLEASTTNGGISTDFPITVQGRIGRQVSGTLGSGGPLIEARTTNGAIRLREG